MKPIIDHKSLVDALGGNTVVAKAISDCTPGRVGAWKIGNRIPPEYWEDIIGLASKAGFSSINANWLMETLRPRQMPTAAAESTAA